MMIELVFAFVGLLGFLALSVVMLFLNRHEKRLP
jgi:hypothetical protein